MHRAVFRGQSIGFIRRFFAVLGDRAAMCGMLRRVGLRVQLRMLLIKFGRELPLLRFLPKLLSLVSIVVGQERMIVRANQSVGTAFPRIPDLIEPGLTPTARTLSESWTSSPPPPVVRERAEFSLQ